MISAQVYTAITVAQLESIARGCGFETRPHESGTRFWMVVHGDPTLVGPNSEGTRVLFLTAAAAVTTPERVNRFNVGNALWCPVYMNLQDRYPGIMRWHLVSGVTRDNIAEMMFIWEHYVGLFLREFDTDQTGPGLTHRDSIIPSRPAIYW